MGTVQCAEYTIILPTLKNAYEANSMQNANIKVVLVVCIVYTLLCIFYLVQFQSLKLAITVWQSNVHNQADFENY